MGFFLSRGFCLDEDDRYYLDLLRARKRSKTESFHFSLLAQRPANCGPVQPLNLKLSLVSFTVSESINAMSHHECRGVDTSF